MPCGSGGRERNIGETQSAIAIEGWGAFAGWMDPHNESEGVRGALTERFPCCSARYLSVLVYVGGAFVLVFVQPENPPEKHSS